MLMASLAFAVMSIAAYALRSLCDWQVIAIARTSLVLIFALLLARAAGARLVFWRPRVLWMRSIAGSLSVVGTFFALTRLPPSEVLTLTNIYPLWVALLSWPLLGHFPSWRVWLCAASGVGGVVLIQQPHFAQGNFASVLALASSFWTSVAMLGLHRLAAIDARAIVAHFSAVALVFCLGAFAVLDTPLTTSAPLSAKAVALLLAVGASATIGQLFLTKAFASGPPARIAVVALSQIVFTMILEVILWGRSFDRVTLLGMALVIAPTAWLMMQRTSRYQEPGKLSTQAGTAPLASSKLADAPSLVE
jgi:drug/metabolite transporter (DMT)-like permease